MTYLHMNWLHSCTHLAMVSEVKYTCVSRANSAGVHHMPGKAFSTAAASGTQQGCMHATGTKNASTGARTGSAITVMSSIEIEPESRIELDRAGSITMCWNFVV